MADPVTPYFETTLGFSANAATYLVVAQGINNADITKTLTDERIATLCTTTRKPGGGTNGHVVPEPAEHLFKTLAFYIRHQARVSRDFVWTSASAAELHKLDMQKKLEETKDPPVEPATVDPDLKNMEKTKEDFIEFLDLSRGINGTPMGYILRDEIKVLPEATDPSANYPSIDEEMKARAPIILSTRVGTRSSAELEDAPLTDFDPVFKADSIVAHGMLRAVFGNSSAWIYGKGVKHKQGRKCALLIFEHYLGAHHTTFVISEVTGTLRGAHYTGEKRNFKFSSYVDVHRAAHNRLIPLKEIDGSAYRGFMEAEKVQYLLQGIKTDSLNTCVAGIIASREMTHSFDKAVTYIQDYIRNASATANFSGGGNRNIMALNSDRGNGGGKRPGGGGRGPNGKKPKFTQAEVDKCTHITKAFYPQDQYNKMSHAEKQKIFQNRQRIPPEDRASNKKPRGIASADSEKILESMEKLNKKFEQTDRRIASIETQLSDDDVPLFDEENEYDENRNNPALCRQAQKKTKKKVRMK